MQKTEPFILIDDYEKCRVIQLDDVSFMGSEFDWAIAPTKIELAP